MPHLYQDPNQTPDVRARDLLEQMTLPEKVGQLCQYLLPKGDEVEIDADEEIVVNDDTTGLYPGEVWQSIPQLIEDGLVGSVLNCYDHNLLRAAQKKALKSRLGIPLLNGGDAIHGNGMRPGATVFPAPIGLAATWDTDLVERVAEKTAEDCRATNIHWNFSPNIDIARDPRWGRVGETFGEDPHLIAEMGAAMIKGYQGDLNSPHNVLACAKHLIAGGVPDNGLNFSPMEASERELRSNHLPPYERAIQTSVATMMAAHNELNGVPCHGNRWLLREVVKDELGFAGFIVSDWTDVRRLHTVHRVADSPEAANRLAFESGIDMHMHGPGFLEPVVAMVESGQIDLSIIDEAVLRVLRYKFQLGLFETPYTDHSENLYREFQEAHQNLALEAACKSATLLQNENQLLPLAPGTKVLLTGPLADNQSLLGDWSCLQPEDTLVTPREGLQSIASPATLEFHDCGNLDQISTATIRDAAAKAADAEVVIVCVGEQAHRHIGHLKTEGENVDRSSLQLWGKQRELIESLAATNPRLVVALMTGRQLALPWLPPIAPAILQLYHPGSMGGQALAQLLYGDANPSGKLPYSMPRSLGQTHLIYNHKPSSYYRGYVDESTEPLFPFAHGLSYTQFEYQNLRCPASITADADLTASVEVANVGDRAGDEIIIVYLQDKYSSVTTPVRKVVAFARVSLAAGESQTVSFSIRNQQLELWNQQMQRVVEAGTFELSVGLLRREFEVLA